MADTESPSKLPDGYGATTGLTGHLALLARADSAGRTGLARQWFCAPFHLGKAYPDGDVLQVQIASASAGILAGDRLAIAIEVNTGAALRLTTPAATRVFAMPGGSASCRQTLRVQAGGWLEHAPEPLVPHRDAAFHQSTRLEIESGAGAFVVDAFAPGRVARGERWAWRRLRLGWDLELDGKLFWRDRLDATGAELADLAEFFRAPEHCVASVVIVAPGLADSLTIAGALRSLDPRRVRSGVTSLRRDCRIVRLIAMHGQALRDALAVLRAELTPACPHLRRFRPALEPAAGSPPSAPAESAGPGVPSRAMNRV